MASKNKRTPLSPTTLRVMLMEFVSEALVIYPFYALMFGDRGDVSAVGVGILLALWQIIQVAAEVPTGVIADRISKKWAIVIGKVLAALGLLTWLVWPDFTGYAIGVTLWGIGGAFTSGALQAYLYESLSTNERAKFGKIYGRVNSLYMIAYTFAYFVSFLIGPHYDLLVLISLITSFGAVAISVSLPSTKSFVESTDLKPRLIRTAIAHIRQTVELKNLVMRGVIIGALAAMILDYMGPYYVLSGAELAIVPLLMAGGNLVGAALFWVMHHVEKQLIKYDAFILGIACALFTATFYFGPIAAVGGLLFFVRVLRMFSVNSEAMLQHYAKPEIRATIGSVYSFGYKIIAAGLMVGVGLASTGSSELWPIRWIIIGSVTLVIIVRLTQMTTKKARAAA